MNTDYDALSPVGTRAAAQWENIMSGQSGIRGYYFQTLVCVLKSLLGDDSEKRWVSMRVEPSDENEKADVIWTFSYGRTRAVQIKHSTKPISAANVSAWATDVINLKADELEILLIGNVTTNALEKKHPRVTIPTPIVLNDRSVVAEAAHLLDVYFERNGATARVPALFRELLVEALCSRFMSWSAKGTSVEREDFDRLLVSWVLANSPQAMTSIEREMEFLRFQLKQQDRVADTKYRLKYDACFEALELVDAIFERAFGLSDDEDLISLGEKARRCHNKLVIACDRTDVLDVFRSVIGVPATALREASAFEQNKHLNPGIVVDLRAAVRRELGFGEDIIDTDRENAWVVATAGYQFQMAESQAASLKDILEKRVKPKTE